MMPTSFWRAFFETLDQLSAVPRNTRVADLPLLLGAFEELVPLVDRDAIDRVDRVVEVDINAIGAQPLQTSLEPLHEIVEAVAGIGLGLAGQDHALAIRREHPADRLLRGTAGVTLGTVEVVDTAIQCVADKLSIAAQATGSKSDVGNLKLGSSEPSVALNLGQRGIRFVRAAPNGQAEGRTCSDSRDRGAARRINSRRSSMAMPTL